MVRCHGLRRRHWLPRLQMGCGDLMDPGDPVSGGLGCRGAMDPGDAVGGGIPMGRCGRGSGDVTGCCDPMWVAAMSWAAAGGGDGLGCGGPLNGGDRPTARPSAAPTDRRRYSPTARPPEVVGA